MQEDGRQLWVKSFDVAAVGTLVALLLVLAAQVAAAVAGGGAWWALPPALVVGVLAADLVSGVVHWLCDTFFAESTPLVGRVLIRPFREHHRDPLALTRHGFFELSGNNAGTVIAPVLLVAMGSRPSSVLALWLHAFVLFFALAVFLTNLFHRWAHASAVPPVVRWLQAAGLILSPELHARHHGGDFSRGYCVTTGWLNAPLDAWRVLPRCARAVRRLRAAPPWRPRGVLG